jgi:RHS repeat-associated protein
LSEKTHPKCGEVAKKHISYYSFGQLVPNRHAISESYRYGFQGQEKDDEIKGEGNSLNYTYRMHDPRIGRFFAVDPLSAHFPWNSSYAFAENKVLMFGELEGREITIPNWMEILFKTGEIEIIIPRITLPRAPIQPTYPIPPLSIPKIQTPTLPLAPTMPSTRISKIEWDVDVPDTPKDLGKDWEETTHPDNKSGSQDFKNKKTGEEIRFDPGKEGKPGYEGKNHWHRRNPDWDPTKGKKDYYLDKDGNPVNKGSGPSHIVPEMIGPMPLPPTEVKKWQEYSNKLKSYNEQMKQYRKDIKEYKEKKKEYDKAMKEYYKNCDCMS